MNTISNLSGDLYFFFFYPFCSDFCLKDTEKIDDYILNCPIYINAKIVTINYK